MAQIKEFSGADLNTISRFGGVSNTLEKINGVTVVAVPAGAFLLDTYTGAAAAYSTRKLKTGVTVAARIRRSGDDIEADVEFDSNNEISLTSPISNASSGTYTDLADFVDHTGTARDAFVDEWKDQSGSGNHAAQATAASQPQLYDATTGLITENGKPIIKSAAGATLETTVDGVVKIFSVARLDRTSTLLQYTAGFDVYYRGWFLAAESGNSSTVLYDSNVYSTAPTVRKNGSAYSLSGKTRNDLYTDFTSQHLMYVDVPSNTGNDIALGYPTTPDPYAMYSHQEVVIYPSTSTHTVSDIETDINSEYLIYQPTDAPTSGLLATYTGAAAAYSVRQLSDKAVIAMRVRRDSDDEERNIGWDANGDLDTQAISDFCDTANGYVTRWWDQSTNGNHADQPVGGTGSNTSQPQIYNGTVVFTENGKPAIQVNDSQYMQHSFTSISQPLTISMVYKTTTVQYSSLFRGDTTSPIGVFTHGSSNSRLDFGTSLNITTNNNAQMHTIALANGASSLVRVNGSQDVSGDAGTNAYDPAFIMGQSAGSTNMPIVQEMVFWGANQSSNFTGIETDTNGHFSIYT